MELVETDIYILQQKKYAVELFGQWTDTDIYAISGNHDRWYIKSNGANIVGDIDRELKNFEVVYKPADITAGFLFFYTT
jgi:predicted MPP superfamily phosphohydrolase